jgi:mRNA interferase MazF
MVNKEKYIPERGDIVWLSFSPTKGHEQKGRRPGLVLTSKEFNQRGGLMFAVPISSKKKGYGTEVIIDTEKVKGVALLNQIRAIDWKVRKVEFVCTVPYEVIERAQLIAVSIIQG